MAIIAGVYCWVESESLDSPIEVSTHPVETGVDITSHIKPQPSTLTLRGEIVGAGYEGIVQHFRNLSRGGYVISYVGRVVFTGAVITSFTTTATSRIAGGVEFDMQLREVRIARKHWQDGVGYTGDLVITRMNFDGTTGIENLSEKKERFHSVMSGETLYFIAQQYRSRGVRVEDLREGNRRRNIFQPGHQGEYEYLVPGAKILLGVW